MHSLAQGVSFNLTMDPNLVKAVPVMTEHDRQADSRAGVTAAICGFISLSLLVVCTIFMYTSLEQRITLTTLEVFHDWLGLQNVFRETASYDPRFNLPSLDYYSTFDGASVSLPLLQDLETRGLLAGSQFTNLSRFFDPATGLPLTGLVDSRQLAVLFGDFVSKFYGKTFFNVSTQYLVASVSVNSSHMVDPRILVRLQRVSGCSFPDAVTGTTPNTRSPGCQCIANAYLHFVRATANTTGDVPMTSRNHAAEQVIRCMDQRVTTRAWAAGSAWTVHPVALAFYSNAIIFLICSAFILSLYHNDLFPMEWDATMRTHVIQGILVCLTGGLVFILMLHAPLGNGLQALGLILSLSTLIFSAHGVLGYPFRSDMTQLSMDPEPHPLMVCFWLNIPLLLPGPVIAVAIAGYTRDVYATWALAFVAAVLGILYMVSIFRAFNPLPDSDQVCCFS